MTTVFLAHFLIVGFPGGIAGIKRFGVGLGKGVHIQFGHHRKTIPSVDSAKQSIEVSHFAAVRVGGAVNQLGFKAILIFKVIVFVDGLCLDGLHLAIAVGKIDQSFVADLELTFEGALILIRNQVCLPQGCVRFQPQLCSREQGTDKAHGVHCLSCGVLLRAERAIRVKRSGDMTEGSAFFSSGAIARTMSGIDMSLVSLTPYLWRAEAVPGPVIRFSGHNCLYSS